MLPQYFFSNFIDRYKFVVQLWTAKVDKFTLRTYFAPISRNIAVFTSTRMPVISEVENSKKKKAKQQNFGHSGFFTCRAYRDNVIELECIVSGFGNPRKASEREEIEIQR
jgi:hypothetical protein